MIYFIAVFKSRKETMDLRNKLEGIGIRCETINTPRSLYVGCGISLKVEMRGYTPANNYVTYTRYNSFVGFYRYNEYGKLVNL